MSTDTPEAEQDKIQAQHVFALMQTSTADGETSGDIGQITKEINQIKDPKLKARLQESVTQMLKRSEKKAEEGSGKKGIFGFLLSGVKKLFSPVLKVLRGIGTAIRTVGQKILDLMKKGIKSGWEDIKSGVVSMKHGIFGAREKRNEDGNIIQESSDGLLKPVLNKIKTTITESMNFLKKGFKQIIGNVSGLTKKAFGALKSGFGKITELFSKQQEEVKENNKDSETGKVGLMDKFRNTEFGAGFMEAFDATKARKEAAKAKKPETYSDEKADEMSQMISGTKESIFSKIVDLASSIRDKLYEEENTESPELNTNNESGSDITTNTNTPESNTETNSNSDDTSNGTGLATVSGSNTTQVNTDVGNSDTSTKSSGTRSSSTSSGGGILGSLGKLLGGAFSSILGVIKIISTLLAPLKGFDMLKELVESIWTEGIQPLNKIFKQIINIIKPIVKTLTEIVSAIADSIATIVGIALDVVQPILEAISPILSTILDTLKPILDIIGVLVKIILTPLMSVVKFVITPILRQLGNNIQIMLGVVQVGFGIVMTALGGLLMGIGSIVKFLTMNSSILDSGKSMANMGKDMITGGINSVKQGIQGTIELIKDTAGQFTGQTDEKKETEEKKENKTQETVESSGSIMDGVVGSGDPSIPDMYGSGNKMDQHSYGNYMNMSERGCGPIAIADAYKRRTGTKIDPSKLAAQMSSSGTYDIKRGTPLSGFVNTSRGLGVNVKVGGVTASSLKQATPNNPITVLGSGTGYGTRKGNNHYMNVIASDKYGGVYVSNPMTGKVQRQSMSDVVGGAQVGLYGSGDSDDLGFTLDDSIKEAFAELAETAGSLLSIFNFEKSTEDEVNEQLQAEQEAEAARQAKYTLDEKSYGSVLIKATKLFQKENPKRDGESDEEYNKRFEESKDKYIARVSGDAMIKSTQSLTDSMMGGINNTVTNSENVTNEVYNAGQSVQSENGDSDGGGYGSSITHAGQGVRNYFVSDKGVALAWPGNKTPSIKDVKLKTDELQSSHSPLHEWFKVTSGRNAWTEPGGWYYRRNNQTEQGKGTTGDYHCGVDIHTDNDDDGESPVYSTTGGVVTHVSDKESNSTGWSIQWKDSANMFHTYMHLNEKPSFDVDDKLEPGAFVGHIGNTPKKEGMGYHLHYQISRVPWPIRGEDMADTINPFTYFKYNEDSENASENEIVSGDVKMSGSTTKEQIFTGLTSLGMSKIGAAGIMGCLAQESGYQSNNLQNSFNDKYGVSDKEYTDLVNSKKESKDEFIHGRYSEDDETVGYGLAQFTSSNLKKDLYEATVERGLSIADMGCQLAEIVRVLKSRDYGSTTLYDAINNAETPTEANKYFLWRYEAGTGFNSDEEVLEWYPWMKWDGINSRHMEAEEVFKNYGSGDAESVDRKKIYVPPIDEKSVKYITGSGDTGFDISPVDSEFSLDNSAISKTLYNLSNSGNKATTVVNSYKIQPNDDYQRAQLKAILTNTYSVRAERVEELLEKILEYISKKQEPEGKQSRTSDNSVTPELFTNNEIPSQVVRLFS